MNRFVSFLLLSLMMMVAMPGQAAWVKDPNYEEAFFPSSENIDGNANYFEANYVWVYTAAFAERFRMPKQWIDPDLKGAEAIAYHRSRRSISHCTAAQGCGPSNDEVLQLFLPADNSLPWPTDAPFNYAWSLNAYGQSWSYLMPRLPSDIEHLRRNTPFLVPSDFLKGSEFSASNPLAVAQPFARVADYLRSVFPGLDFVSLLAPGLGAMQQGDVGILTLRDRQRNTDAETHITLPAAFSQRIETYQKTWQTMTADYPASCAQNTYPWPATRQYTLGTWQPRAPDRQPDYVDAFTMQGARENRLDNGGQFSEDPNIWIYTTAFAKRFGMPLEWADDNLKGALALAYRKYENVNKMKLGLNWNSSLDVLHIYLPDTAGLPWVKDTPFFYQKGRSNEQASEFLRPHNKRDSESYAAVTLLKKSLPHLPEKPRPPTGYWVRGSDISSIMAYINYGRVHAGKSLPHGSTWGRTFQHNLYPDIDLLEIQLSSYITKEHWPQFLLPDYKSPPQQGHIVFTWSAQVRKNYTDVYDTVDYLIEIPKSFFDRGQTYYQGWALGNRKTFETCDPKLQPWRPLCQANQLACEYLQPQPARPNPLR